MTLIHIHVHVKYYACSTHSVTQTSSYTCSTLGIQESKMINIYRDIVITTIHFAIKVLVMKGYLKIKIMLKKACNYQQHGKS